MDGLASLLEEKGTAPETENYDYFSTPEAMFIQRGHYSLPGTRTAVPIYVREEKGDRLIKGKNYRKWSVQTEEAPKLALADRIPNLCYTNFRVPEEIIGEVYRHREFIPTGLAGEISQTIGDILETDVSAIGSLLLGSLKEGSDWDFVVYGLEAQKKIEDAWPTILGELNGSEPSPDEVYSRAAKYAEMRDMDSETLFRLFSNWHNRFNIGSQKVSLSFTYNPGEEIPYPDGERNDWVQVEVFDRIVDASRAGMMPRFYQGENFKIFSFRWIDQKLAKEGDMVRIKGNLNGSGEIVLNQRCSYIIPEM